MTLLFFRKALRLIHWEYCFLSLWLDPSHPLRGLFRKWALLDIVCFFGVTVRRKAFLPSGIHDNAVIQSASHLLPFTLPEETIMGRDGPLSTDEARSHFLDGFVCVCMCVYVSVCSCMCIVWPERLSCFITQELHEIVAPFWRSHSGGGYRATNCLSILYTPTLLL